VSDYLANIDHAPDPTVKREAFSSEITIAYDVLANTWIHTREPKVLNNLIVLAYLGCVRYFILTRAN